MTVRLSRAQAVSLAAGLYASGGGAASLLGWVLGIPRLTTWDGLGITIKVNAALCCIAAGLALILLTLGPSRKASIRALASFVALIGGLTLLEHLTGIDFGIDTLLLDEPAGARATAAPGRMGPPAATSLLIAGGALLLATCGPRGRRVACVLAIAPVVIAMLGVSGYLFGASQLYGVARLTGVALQTATIIAALGVGLIAAVPEHGLLALLLRDDAGGALFRKLLLPLALVPLVLGWLRVRGERAGLYGLEIGTASRTMIEIVLLLGLLWWTAEGVSRHSRAARRAEQALREADRLKDEFLAVLAHELRNPLAPLRTGLELMRSAPRDSGAVARTLAMMQRQLVQMTRLVDDLLDISRISRGKIELRKERIELAEVIESAVETCVPVLDARDHELVIAQSPEPIYVDADLTRLGQVLANLLNNAAKYTDPGGRIVLTAVPEGPDVLLRVRDNGVGIAAEALPRLFQMFVRADGPLESARGGLGIGLAIAKRLVEMHGGSIAVHSPPLGDARDPGAARCAGSEFIVRLPVAAQPAGSGARTQSAEQSVAIVTASAARPALQVVVADDNVDAADSIAALLQEMGHDVRVAHDGQAAVAILATVRPQLALLDIGMPELNGYEVARRVRSEPWGRSIRLVALTGWGQAEDRRRSAEAGFDHHVVKPMTLAALEQVLADAGDGVPASPAPPAAEARG